MLLGSVLLLGPWPGLGRGGEYGGGCGQETGFKTPPSGSSKAYSPHTMIRSRCKNVHKIALLRGINITNLQAYSNITNSAITSDQRLRLQTLIGCYSTVTDVCSIRASINIAFSGFHTNKPGEDDCVVQPDDHKVAYLNGSRSV